MAEQKFGGDDDSSGNPLPAAPKKIKLPLWKFELSPDANVRDLFWKIMASYAATKKPGVDLGLYYADRFALMQIALSIGLSPHPQAFGLSTKFVIHYANMMIIDANWRDAWFEYIERLREANEKIQHHLIFSIKTLVSSEPYRQIFSDLFTQMLRNRNSDVVALHYLANIKNVDLITSAKKELIILARGGIGQDQVNAVRSLSLLKTDQEVKRSLLVLLAHWDSEARFAAVTALKGFEKDEEIRTAASRRINLETDEEIKKLLVRLSK
ncbi:hypothetical protein HY990_06290 [Candidatus Micrarchaeota archaeon]|nr:hypothetical protein [Candidatus Micrarchaeota archaeon]